MMIGEGRRREMEREKEIGKSRRGERMGQEKSLEGEVRERDEREGREGMEKTRQRKSRQVKARQGKARQGKARQGKARQGNRESKDNTTTNTGHKLNTSAQYDI